VSGQEVPQHERQSNFVMTQTDPGGARALVDRARDAERRGDSARSLGLYDDAIEVLDREHDLALLADTLRWKGTLHREQGETEAAYRCYTQSLIHAEQCGSIARKAHGFNCLAIIAQRRGNLAESEKLYLQAAEFAGKAGDVRLLGMIEQNRGVLFNMRGNFVAAEARYLNSLGAFERANDDEAVSWVLNNIGMLYTKLGHYQRAIEIFGRGLTIAKSRHDSLVESVLVLNLALVWVAIGKLDDAASSLAEAQARGDNLTIAEALKCRARIERERGAFHESIATLRIGIFEAEGLEDRLLQAEMLREFGQTSRALGNSADARLAWQEAAESFEDVGARHEAAEINALLASLPT
jgi:tetratricopeptide (TPR) repeat protein